MVAVKRNDLNEQQRGTKFHLGRISYENERSRRVYKYICIHLQLFHSIKSDDLKKRH